MTQEEKDLLLKDLCGRLPYGVLLQCAGNIGEKLVNIDKKGLINHDWDIDEVKPYLRSMSSMTEPERFEVEQIIGYDVEVRDDFLSLLSPSIKRVSYAELLAVFKWLNAHHFDFRGLIEKGLAIEVTKENNPYKE